MTILTEETWKRYRANQGCVYLVHATGTNRYKIGRSINLAFRLDQLRGQSPYPLTCLEWFWSPDAISDEKALHAEIKFSRVYGEWFELDEMTEEELHSDNFDVDRYSLSIDGLRSWNFHHSRPEIKIVSTSLAEKITSVIIAEIKEIDNVFPGENMNSFRRWAIYHLGLDIYLGLYSCQSLTSLSCLCNFIEKHWILAIKRSIPLLPAILNTCHSEQVKIVIRSTFNGFLASIAEGCLS